MPGEIAELRNGRPPEDLITAGIEWALGSENLGGEFEVVVRSGEALRRKWPQLVAAARRRRQKGGSDADLRAWMASGGQVKRAEDFEAWVRSGGVRGSAA